MDDKDRGPVRTSASELAVDERGVQRAVSRLAIEIGERLGAPEGYALVGIVTGGATLAHRLAAEVAAIEGSTPQVGTVDITLYLDDLYTGLEKPVLGETELPFEVSGKVIVLVDDVLFTGRTVRAAMDVIMDYGRPARIELAVLVDRGHRELPIAADYVGRRLSTGKDDRVDVAFRSRGDSELGDAVIIARREA